MTTLYELHLGALLVKNAFEPIVDEWLASHVYSQHTMALARRRAFRAVLLSCATRRQRGTVDGELHRSSDV